MNLILSNHQMMKSICDESLGSAGEAKCADTQ